MIDRRTGDPEYLALLDRITWDVDGAPPSWQNLTAVWDSICDDPSEDRLFELSRVAMALVAYERDESVEYLKAEAVRLHIAKNAGYAGADQPDPWANFRQSAAFGITPFGGVLVRLSDKYIRSVNLRRDPSNERIGESLADTLFDLAAYALIAICLRREAAA